MYTHSPSHTHSHTPSPTHLLPSTPTVAPTITVPPNNVATQVGQSATFSCFAIGTPRPIIRWVHRGQEVGGGSTLVISDVNVGDQGRYTCRVNNSAGVAMATANLTVFGKYIRFCTQFEVDIFSFPFSLLSSFPPFSPPLSSLLSSPPSPSLPLRTHLNFHIV